MGRCPPSWPRQLPEVPSTRLVVTPREDAGCIFANGGAWHDPERDFKGAPPLLIDGAASFVDCTFQRNAGTFVGAKSPLSHVIEARDSSTNVRLERCLFTDNRVDHLLLRVNSSSSIYADDLSLTVWDATVNKSFPVQPLASIPSRPLFLTAFDPWLQSTQQVPPPPCMPLQYHRCQVCS